MIFFFNKRKFFLLKINFKRKVILELLIIAKRKVSIKISAFLGLLFLNEPLNFNFFHEYESFTYKKFPFEGSIRSIYLFIRFLESNFNFDFSLTVLKKLLVYFQFFVDFFGFFYKSERLIFFMSSLLKFSVFSFVWSFKKYCYLFKELRLFFFKLFMFFFSKAKFLIFKKSIFLYFFLRFNILNSVFVSRYFFYFFPEYFLVFCKLDNFLGFLANRYLRFALGDVIMGNLFIFWKMLPYNTFTAQIVASYVCIRLRQRFRLMEIIRPVLKSLMANPYVSGFRMTCSGRFTKKEIATYDLRTYSSVPFSGVSKHLDYGFSEVILKYSVCGVKVWLHKRPRVFDFLLPESVFLRFDQALEFFSLSDFFYKISFRKILRNPLSFDFNFALNFLKFYYPKRGSYKKEPRHLKSFLNRLFFSVKKLPFYSNDFFFISSLY